MPSRTNYSDEQAAFLKEGYKKWYLPELTAKFNEKFGTRKSESAIKSACKNRKFKSGRQRGLPRGAYYSYSTEEADFIKTAYKELPLTELTRAFNEKFPENQKTNMQIRAFTKNHKVRCDRTGKFEKGNKSWNAGTKGLMKPNRGNFKKGSVPHNTKPIGHERICSKDGYILVKVAEANPYTGAKTRYRPKHRIIWEAAHGPIPRDHMVRFKDGDQLNCALENLELVSKNLNCRLNKNGYSDAPNELKPTIRAIAEVTVAAAERAKGAQLCQK